MSFLNHLWCHVKRSSTDCLIDLIKSFELFRETEICDLYFKLRVKQVYIFQKLLLLIFVIVAQLIVLRKMEHDVLKLEVPMNYKNRHHIVEALYQHPHDLLNNYGINIKLLELHEFFEVTTITIVHKHVISRISLDCFSEFDDIVAVNGVLILYLTNYKLFF